MGSVRVGYKEMKVTEDLGMSSGPCEDSSVPESRKAAASHQGPGTG